MKQLFQSEDRKLYLAMIAMALVTILASVTLSLAMAAYVNQAVKDTYAGIVGTVAQRYPKPRPRSCRICVHRGPIPSNWEPLC